MASRGHDAARGSALGRAMEDARLGMGLGREDLAGLLELSRVTLRSLERGGDGRASTLRRVMGKLGTVLPTDAVGFPGRPAVGVDSAWRFDRALHGTFARRAVRDVVVGSDGTVSSSWSILDVEVSSDDLASAARLADLLRLVAQGSGGLAARLAALADRLASGATEASVEVAGARHAVSVTPGPRARLAYERRDAERRVDLSAIDASSAAGCASLGSVAVVPLPVERVTLCLRLPGGQATAAPVALAWLGALVPEAGEPALGGCLRASGVEASNVAGAHALAVERPPVGLVVGLGWRPAAAARRRPRTTGGSPHPAGIGAALRRARESAGLSVREAARRMGVGPMTLSDAERARDARISTLEAALGVLPDLSPWHLLAPGELSPAQAWAYRRDLFGCEVDRETKLVEIDDTGNARMRIETRGLRRIAAGTGPLRVRMGFSAPTVLPTRASLRAVAVPGDRAGALRITAVVGVEGERLHQLTIPARLARTGITCVRELVHEGVYALTSERARRMHGERGPFHEGASFAAVLPVRCLRLVVRFPPGAWPMEFTCHAWPMHVAPDPAVPGLAGRLHPEGLRLHVDEPRREVALTVGRPLIGAKYGIGWRLR